MLADDFIAHSNVFLDNVRRGLGTYPEGLADDYRLYVWAVRNASKFVLSPGATEIVFALAQDERGVGSSADRLIVPDEFTWIEWTEEWGRCGVVLTIDSSGTGAGFFTLEGWRYIPIVWPFVLDRAENGLCIAFHVEDPDADAMFEQALAELPADRRTPELVRSFSTGSRRALLERMRRRTIAALALINSPRISGSTPAELTKLNRARMKRGRPELLTYSTVVIRPGLASTRPPVVAGPGDAGRALHKVRAHFRLRLGKVEIVRSHWRGDEANGVRLHDYRVEA